MQALRVDINKSTPCRVAVYKSAGIGCYGIAVNKAAVRRSYIHFGAVGYYLRIYRYIARLRSNACGAVMTGVGIRCGAGYHFGLIIKRYAVFIKFYIKSRGEGRNALEGRIIGRSGAFCRRFPCADDFFAVYGAFNHFFSGHGASRGYAVHYFFGIAYALFAVRTRLYRFAAGSLVRRINGFKRVRYDLGIAAVNIF